MHQLPAHVPYLKKWHETYSDKGLVIIGVHSPEFEFEKSEKNLAQAVSDFALPYPIVQDNDFATWRAYRNRYWPAKYIIDTDGYIRFTHFGEGAYDETEAVIQELMRGFASNESITQDAAATYSAPAILRANTVAFSGEWNVAEEYASPSAGASLSLNFDAKEVYLVMRPKDESARVRVLLDGAFQSEVTVDGDRLYELVSIPSAGRHTLQLESPDANVELYAFTFG